MSLKKKLAAFIELLGEQAAGDRTAAKRLAALSPSLEDGYCLFNLHEQWASAFSYRPGRLEALPLIQSLAKKLARYKSDDTLKLFKEKEWEGLARLRGPVESVLLLACASCGAEFVSMGTSGFYDAVGLVCRGCGNVYFKSTYDDGPTPLCACGKKYKAGCGKCGKKKGKIKSERSPFAYFADHSYTTGPGA